MLKDYPEVLTVAETAKVLRIGRNKEYEIIKKGKISAIKLSGKILVPKTSLVTFLILVLSWPGNVKVYISKFLYNCKSFARL